MFGFKNLNRQWVQKSKILCMKLSSNYLSSLQKEFLILQPLKKALAPN